MTATALCIHRASGLRGEVIGRSYRNAPIGSGCEVEIASAVGEIIWHQEAKRMYCCEFGELQYPGRCPLHNVPGSFVLYRHTFDPLKVPLETFEAEWEPVADA